MARDALTETLALDEAVEVAIRLTNSEDTLIVVTADHAHVMTMAGYPTRGNPILGKYSSSLTNYFCRHVYAIPLFK